MCASGMTDWVLYLRYWPGFDSAMLQGISHLGPTFTSDFDSVHTAPRIQYNMQLSIQTLTVFILSPHMQWHATFNLDSDSVHTVPCMQWHGTFTSDSDSVHTDPCMQWHGTFTSDTLTVFILPPYVMAHISICAHVASSKQWQLTNHCLDTRTRRTLWQEWVPQFLWLLYIA